MIGPDIPDNARRSREMLEKNNQWYGPDAIRRGWPSGIDWDSGPRPTAGAPRPAFSVYVTDRQENASPNRVGREPESATPIGRGGEPAGGCGVLRNSSTKTHYLARNANPDCEFRKQPCHK